MLWAVVSLLLRIVWLVEPNLLLWGGVGLIPAVAVGIALAYRNVPSTTAVRSLLDREGCLGGLLMAAGDADIGGWNERLVAAPSPALRWQFGRQWMMLVASVGFLLAVFLAPDRYLPASEDNALHVSGEMGKLAEKAQVLKEEKIVTPEKAEALEKDLERIREGAQGKDPAKTMEAIDHLEQAFKKSASEAAESSIQKTEAAARVKELAKALSDSQGKMGEKPFNEAMKELAEMAQKAASECDSLSKNLSDEVQKACECGHLTAEQLDALSKAAEKCQACEKGKIGKLVKAELVEAEALEACKEAGECDEAALAEVLGKCKGGDMAMEEALLADMAGRGGVTRGPGAAAMTWTDKANKDGAKFKEKVLPPASVSALKKSQLTGVSIGDPTAKKSTGGSAGGALNAAQAGGGESQSQTILPEHEKTVRQYFERKKK